MSLRYEDLVVPRLCDENGAAEIVKKRDLFRRMVEHKWIAPIISRHSCKLFALHQIHACVDLLERGFYPGEKDPDKNTLAAARKGAFRPDYVSA